MPINEAAGYTRNNLTKEQKRQAEAAIFGLQEIPVSPELTQDEIERMRTILAQHDSRKGVQEFDLNNPPKKPYVHQEYPRVMYHHGKRQMRVAKSPDEVHAAEAAGWQKEPFLPEGAEPPEIELDPESAQEAAEADAKLRKVRK